MADHFIKVGAEMDVSAIVAGARQAGQSIDNLGNSIQQQAAKFKASGLTVEQVTSALVNLGFSEKEAAAAAQAAAAANTQLAGSQVRAAATTEAAAGAATLDTAAVSALTAATEALTLATQSLTASKAGVRTATDHSVTGYHAAHTAIGAMEGRMQGATRTLAEMIGQTQIIGPLLVAAFPIFAALGLIQVLQHVGETLAELADEERKLAAETANFERQMLRSADALAKMQDKAAELAGGTLAEAASRLAHYGSVTMDVSSDTAALNERLSETTGILGLAGQMLGSVAVAAWHLFDDASQQSQRALVNFNREVADSIKQQKDLAPAILEVQQRIRALNEEMNSVPLAAYSDATQENFQRIIAFEQDFLDNLKRMQQAGAIDRANIEKAANQSYVADVIKSQEAILEARKRSADASLTLLQQSVEQAYSLGQISLEAEVAQLEAIEARKLEIEREYFAQRRALLERERDAGKTALELAPELSRLGGEEAASRIASETRMNQIHARAAAERKAIADAAALAEIEAAKAAAEQQISITEGWASRQVELHRMTAEQQTAILVTAENERYAAERTALSQRSEILSREAEKNKAQIIAINGQLEVLEIQHQAKLTEIQESAEIRTITSRRRMAEEMSRLSVESEQRTLTIHTQEISSNARLEELRLAGMNVTGQAKARMQLEISQREIAELERVENEKVRIQIEHLTRLKTIMLDGKTEGEFAAGASPEELIQLEQTNREIEGAEVQHQARMRQLKNQGAAATQTAVNQERAVYMRFFEQVNQGFSQTIQGIIQGTQSAGQAFARLAGNMILSVGNALLQVGLRYAEHFLLVEILEKTAWGRRIATWIAGETVKKGVQTAADVAAVTGAAGVGAAAAFASVLMALPFPINVSVAPGVAAAEFGQIMAIGLPAAIAEKGGVVPQDMPIFAHAKEMILPAGISTAVQQAIPAIQQFNTSVGLPERAVSDGPREVHHHSSSTRIEVKAFDAAGVRDFIRRNQRQFISATKSMVRNGAQV